MLDINFIRENPDAIKEGAIKKNIDPHVVDDFLTLDNDWRGLVKDLDNFRALQKKLGEERQIEEARELKEKIRHLEGDLRSIETAREEALFRIPTIPSKDTPVGKSEADNVEVYRWGEARVFDFEPKDHIELGKSLDILDFERGAKVAGFRGYYIKNEGVMLVMGIMMYALEKMVAKGYKPMIPPTLIKEFALLGSGYFKGTTYNPETDEVYQLSSADKEVSGETSKDKKFLVGTAEPSLLAYHSGEVLRGEDLPLKISGYSQCYRSEIGSYGRDVKGMYRVHEFMKVEQVVLAPADLELAASLQDEMVKISGEMHQELGLPYRRIQICTGDLSAGKYRQFDTEAWLPATKRWAETGSASNFLDWQARRLDVKYVDGEGNKKYVYMLNNTALPSPRIFIAILENYQQKDGSVVVPEVLRKYTGFGKISNI